MAKRISDNVAMLMRAVHRLAPIRDRLVFLGGAVTELFITEPGVQGFRRTKDVDVVIDGRLEIVGDVTTAPADLRAAIAAKFGELLTRPDAEEVVAAQLLPDAESQGRLPLVLERIEAMARLG